MALPINFDWKKPDYLSVIKWRAAKLQKIRANPKLLAACMLHYKDNPIDFINDWGCTFDPRNAEVGLPAHIPFLLFPRQEEMIEWILDRWKSRTPGICVKSREMGASWLTIAFAVTTCIFNKGIVAGFGSRTEDDVDNKGDPNSLFEKARQFINGLPIEFRGGCNLATDASHMKIRFPETGSMMSGDAGKNIGRGGRASFYFVDESAFIEHPQSVEASLSQTTNCRIDISTPNGNANPFAKKFLTKKVSIFPYHWRDDPRKDEKWYAKQKEELDPVTLAQEVDMDFNASIEGIVIPSAWIQSSIDAHIKLGIEPSGIRKLGLDIADEGKDLNAACGIHGVVIEYLETWSGKNSDILETVAKAILICDTHKFEYVFYDADGLGAGCRGDARALNEKRKDNKQKLIEFYPFRGSGEVLYPKQQTFKGRKNKDYFANAKAQGWWMLRNRFMETHRAITENREFDPDNIISISSKIKDYDLLVSELSQPTYSINSAGKLLVDKSPSGTSSPNRADSVMIACAPERKSTGVEMRIM